MAKTTAPLLSFDAAGQIGKAQVYAKWKGRSYARRYSTPANPRTTEQTLTRDTFAFLQNVYKFSPALITDVWELYAQGLVMTARNAFTKQNLPVLREAANLDGMIISPGALGGIPPATFTVTPGDDQLTLACTAPASTPVGWTLVGAIFAVLRDGDPQSSIYYVPTAVEDDSSAYSQVFASLASAATYQCWAFLKWTRPDGRTAYSPSLNDQGLTT